jgi:hypothetical protein
LASAYELIKSAILNKQQIVATYQGHRREMCPHVLGRKNGRLQCLFYQFGGSSSSGPVGTPGNPHNWRCMPVDKLQDVEVRDGPWYTAGNHSQQQSCVGTIDVEVTS